MYVCVRACVLRSQRPGEKRGLLKRRDYVSGGCGRKAARGRTRLSLAQGFRFRMREFERASEREMDRERAREREGNKRQRQTERYTDRQTVDAQKRQHLSPMSPAPFSHACTPNVQTGKQAFDAKKRQHYAGMAVVRICRSNHSCTCAWPRNPSQSSRLLPSQDSWSRCASHHERSPLPSPTLRAWKT